MSTEEDTNAPLNEVQQQADDVSVIDVPVSTTTDESIDSAPTVNSVVDSTVATSVDDSSSSAGVVYDDNLNVIISDVTAPVDLVESDYTVLNFPKDAKLNPLHFGAAFKTYFDSVNVTMYVKKVDDDNAVLLLASSNESNLADAVNYANYYMNDNLEGGLSYITDFLKSYTVASEPKAKRTRNRFEDVDSNEVVQLGADTTNAMSTTSTSNNDNEHTQIIYIDESKVGIIIGRNGDTIKMLQNECHGRVEISKDPTTDGKGRPVTLNGSVSVLSHLNAEIQRLCMSTETKNPDRSKPHDVVFIPPRSVGLLIGRNGDTLKMLQMRYSVDIYMQKDSDVTDPSANREVLIFGLEKDRNACKAVAEQIAQGKSDALGTAHLQYMGNANNNMMGGNRPFNNTMGGGNMNNMSGPGELMMVGNQFVGLIIGKRGETIKRLQQDNNVRVNVDKEETGNPLRKITITGAPQDVARVKTLIEGITTGSRDHMASAGGPPQQYGGYNNQQQGGYQQQQYNHQQPQQQQYGNFQQRTYPNNVNQQQGGYQQQHGGYNNQQQGGYQQQQQQPQQQYGNYNRQPQPQQAAPTASIAPHQRPIYDNYVTHYTGQGYSREDAERYALYYLANPPQQ